MRSIKFSDLKRVERVVVAVPPPPAALADGSLRFRADDVKTEVEAEAEVPSAPTGAGIPASPGGSARS
jgi:hypothetical protein